MNTFSLLISAVVCLSLLFGAEQTTFGMCKESSHQELSQKDPAELNHFASIIYQGNFYIETIAASWGLASCVKEQNEIAGACSDIRREINQYLYEENRLKTGKQLSEQERHHIGTIYYTLFHLIKEYPYKTFCVDVKNHKRDAKVLEYFNELVELLRDFNFYDVVYDRNNPSSDVKMIAKCQELEPKIIEVINRYHAAYDTVKTYYEAVAKTLRQCMQQKPELRKQLYFCKYFSEEAIKPYLHQDQAMHQHEPIARVESKKVHAPILSQQEINAQVNALMKQFETKNSQEGTAQSAHHSPIKKNASQSKSCKQKKAASKQPQQQRVPEISAYDDSTAIPMIATLAPEQFKRLSIGFKMVRLFEYQDFWSARLEHEHNPSALLTCIKTIFKDYVTHKKILNKIFDPKQTPIDLMLLQGLIEHAKVFHEHPTSEAANKEKIDALVQKYQEHKNHEEANPDVLTLKAVLLEVERNTHERKRIVLPELIYQRIRKVALA